jgi:UDP-2,3-diacylglucosamine pyrophosphatase LpxH
MVDAVILSDIHLGSSNCQVQNVCRLFEEIVEGELPLARLILNGDVFHSPEFGRLSKEHWKVLSLIRRLSDRIEIIWLCGNHDASAEIIAHKLGVTVMEDFILESDSQRILILHGHIFDEFLEDHPVVTWLADRAYTFLQRIDRTHYLAKLAKHGSKTFLRCAKKVEDEAVKLADRRGCTAVCCGHTHAAVLHREQPIAYFNSGCWTELPCTYLTVAGGTVHLHTFESEAEVAGHCRHRQTHMITGSKDRGIRSCSGEGSTNHAAFKQLRNLPGPTHLVT